jgi:VanZ family protein
MVPFQFQSLSLEEGWERFRQVCSEPVRVEMKADWLANILLGIPIAYFLTGALCVDRSWRARFLVVLVLPVCVALSTLAEFAQVFIPARVSSLNDIVAQTVGAGMGMVAWLLAGQRITDSCRAILARGGDSWWALRMLPAYFLLLVLVHILPLDLTLSPAAIYRKYRAGAVRLKPFTFPTVDLGPLVEKNFWQLVYFFPLGVLAAHFPGPAWRRGSGWARVALVGLVAAAGIEFLKLFVVSRSSDTTNVITGTLAVLAGWGVARAARHVPHDAGLVRALRLVLFLAWLAVALFLNWRPFHFDWDLSTAARRLWAVSWVPFADYHIGFVFNSLDQFLHKTALFFLLGLLLAAPSPQARSWARWRVVLLAALLAAGIEVGQAFLPTRYPSLTDVLIETFGAWLGALAAGPLAKRLESREPLTTTRQNTQTPSGDRFWT